MPLSHFLHILSEARLMTSSCLGLFPLINFIPTNLGLSSCVKCYNHRPVPEHCCFHQTTNLNRKSVPAGDNPEKVDSISIKKLDSGFSKFVFFQDDATYKKWSIQETFPLVSNFGKITCYFLFQ
jgi:hypothetical protein